MSRSNRYLLREYAREILRLIVGGLFYFSGYLWLKKKFTKRYGIRILMYHRVNDTSVDSMTIHPEKFEHQISYIKRKFRIIKVSQLVDLIESQREFPVNTLAVAFDDGYLDNFTVAAPILAKYGAPACFFVSADLVGTDRVFEHDRREGVQFPMMTWANLSELLSQGYEIGSHAASHANLADCDGKDLQYEVSGAKGKLEEKLGAEIALFALPFGYRQHVNPSVITLVKQAGYRCCCYGYGGVNTMGTDPYHIRRQCVTPSWSSFVFRRMLDGAFDFRMFEKHKTALSKRRRFNTLLL